ncbi:hypothetical protein CH063_16004 [Colletotrichum higginsianum]|nr:hypothetical protein ColKHC_11787 [Colletotrichum higginsianum]CCF47734.1 hypothetical protein CH063_16004 [Colletotrichum higginsianum]
MATDLSKSIEDAMDVDEDEPEINVTPTKSRGRKKVEAQGPSRFGRTARHPPTESGAVVDSDDEPFTLSSASRRKRTQKQVLGPLENNDSESSYKVQGAGTDSDDDDEPISSLDRSSRKKKLPARFRSSSYEED